MRTNHSIQDFALSKSGKWIVVYGAHYSRLSMAGTEVESATSIFEAPDFRKAKKVFYTGKGVYEVLFDNEESHIYLSTTYGLIKIDTSNFNIESYGMESNNNDLSKYLGACENTHLKYDK